MGKVTTLDSQPGKLDGVHAELNTRPWTENTLACSAFVGLEQGSVIIRPTLTLGRFFLAVIGRVCVPPLQCRVSRLSPLTPSPFQPHQCQCSSYSGPVSSVHFLLHLQNVLQGPELDRVGVIHGFDFLKWSTGSSCIGKAAPQTAAWHAGRRNTPLAPLTSCLPGKVGTRLILTENLLKYSHLSSATAYQVLYRRCLVWSSWQPYFSVVTQSTDEGPEAQRGAGMCPRPQLTQVGEGPSPAGSRGHGL